MVASLVPEDGRAAERGERRVRGADRADLRAVPHRLSAIRRAIGCSPWMSRALAARLAARVSAARTWRSFIMRRPPGGSTICRALGELCRAHGPPFAGGRRQQLRRGSHRFRRREPRGSGRYGEQVSARRAGRVVCDGAAGGVREGAQPNVLPGPRPPRDAYRISAIRHSRPRCMLTMLCVEALREFEDKAAGRRVTPLRRAGGAGARRAGGDGHRAGYCRGTIFGRAARVPSPGGLDYEPLHDELKRPVS